MSKLYSSADLRTGLERQKAHEAIELAKLAVQISHQTGRHPQNYLEEALDLVHKASEVIKKSRE